MTETKLDEISRAIDNGADDIDVVWNLTSFRTGLPWTKIEIARCSKLAHERQKILKVILETAYLTDDEIVRGCKLCADAGADFVKTSTGFGPGGAQARQVANAPGPAAGSWHKASAGIKTAAHAGEMIKAGASRIGTSSGISIVTTQPIP